MLTACLELRSNRKTAFASMQFVTCFQAVQDGHRRISGLSVRRHRSHRCFSRPQSTLYRQVVLSCYQFNTLTPFLCRRRSFLPSLYFLVANLLTILLGWGSTLLCDLTKPVTRSVARMGDVLVVTHKPWFHREST